MNFEYQQFRTSTENKRPDRDTCIGHEDITNLIIALNTTSDVSEFLAAI